MKVSSLIVLALLCKSPVFADSGQLSLGFTEFYADEIIRVYEEVDNNVDPGKAGNLSDHPFRQEALSRVESVISNRADYEAAYDAFSHGSENEQKTLILLGNPSEIQSAYMRELDLDWKIHHDPTSAGAVHFCYAYNRLVELRFSKARKHKNPEDVVSSLGRKYNIQLRISSYFAQPWRFSEIGTTWLSIDTM